jgi:glycosyltransferase involved in cell wall biosynthesis
MRVLMLVQLIDEKEWLRGFTVKWVRALAARVERVEVLTLELGQADLPDNVGVHSMGKEKGKNRLRELFAFHRAMITLAPQVDVIFSHMTPLYTILAAPYAWLYRKPQVMWYAHGHIGWKLRLAHRLAHRVVTSTPEGFRLKSRKLDIVGQGIDMAQFHPPDDPLARERLVLAVGRLAPIKKHEVFIEAVGRLVARPGFEDVKAIIAGGTSPEFPGYDVQLAGLIDSLGLAEHIELAGAVPFDAIAGLYRRASLLVNLSDTGSLDKVVLEGMATGLPVIAHNAVFLPVLGDQRERLWCPSLAPDTVADQMAGVLSLPAADRAALGMELAERVRAEHAIEGLFDRLVAVFEAVTPGKQR